MQAHIAILRRMLWLELYILVGPFYPPTIDNSAWLKYYSRVFDYVEIDSSFHRIPSPIMVKNWYKRSP
jgi:uncharacterized protein YecE (DUF72 family)